MDRANPMLDIQNIARFLCEYCYYTLYVYMQQMVLFCYSNNYKIINIKSKLYISK